MTAFVNNVNKKLLEDKFWKQKPESLTTNSIDLYDQYDIFRSTDIRGNPYVRISGSIVKFIQKINNGFLEHLYF